LQLAPINEVGLDRVLVHDAHRADPTQAFALSRLTDSGRVKRSPIGIFRQVSRPTFDDLGRQQLAVAAGDAARPTDQSVQTLLAGESTWELA